MFRVVLVSLVLAMPSAEAAILIYTNKISFLVDTAATDRTGAIPNLGIVTGTATVGTVTVSAPKWLSPDWSSLLPGQDIAISDGAGPTIYSDGVDFGLGGPVYAAGFDFHEPGSSTATIDGCNLVCTDSTFLVTLLNGATTVDSFQFNAPDDVLAFVGVSSSLAFDTVQIREIVGTDDNEFYGHVYAASAPAVVPVPAAAWLFGGALGALGLVRRRARDGLCA